MNYYTLLWLIAFALGVWGIVEVATGRVLFGVLLLVLAFAVGPGGWSIFR